MPKDMYVSPSIFQLEIERLFHGEWICAGRSDDTGGGKRVSRADGDDGAVVVDIERAPGVGGIAELDYGNFDNVLQLFWSFSIVGILLGLKDLHGDALPEDWRQGQT